MQISPSDNRVLKVLGIELEQSEKLPRQVNAVECLHERFADAVCD
jgi:hypothetical protein